MGVGKLEAYPTWRKLPACDHPHARCSHLEELAWLRWQAEEEEEAGQLLAVSAALGADGEAVTQLTRARVESLFEPFLASLRVVEESALDDAG